MCFLRIRKSNNNRICDGGESPNITSGFPCLIQPTDKAV